MSSNSSTSTHPLASLNGCHNGNGKSSLIPVDAASAILDPTDGFIHRHIGPNEADTADMLETLGYPSLDAFTAAVVPASIRLPKMINVGPARGEAEVLAELHAIASKNKVYRSFLGMGYHDTVTPPVILRNVLENPGWYTQYTPYQAEIAQGRLEALLNFQTMVSDLTGLPLAGASLLDESTAAAEAMAMCHSIAGGTEGGKHEFFVSSHCHPQTIAVVHGRAKNMGVQVVIGDEATLDFATHKLCGVLLQYPTTDGRVVDYRGIIEKAHASGAQAVVATDLLALTLITPPGEFGADIVVGCSQRFGVPMGFGGPHAAFIATKLEHNRRMPGRIIGVSKDAQGNTALRMAIQTREQHIRRDKATSNICTAQALLAVMASMYAVYHGPDGLRKIAKRVHVMAECIAEAARKLGHAVAADPFFDTVRIAVKGGVPAAQAAVQHALDRKINIRNMGDGSVCIALDETADRADLVKLIEVLSGGKPAHLSVDALASAVNAEFSGIFARSTGYLTHPVFSSHHSEHEMLRYIFKLQARDLSLVHSMIPLGSCTMKLNATSEMIPVTWPTLGKLHPFVPADQAQGYHEMFATLEHWLRECTGFDAVSLQPNAGAQGEYAGLLVIRAYLESKGQGHRKVCLIPDSAHGTNPASAVMAGFSVVAVKNKDNGDIDLDDLRAKVEANKANIGAFMVTYPSTYGVFEEAICEICKIIHDAGGQVYMDGANMNAQVGLTSPAAIGADVCHLNLHKTFCIPHGGGGPGMGPICVRGHLAPFLPGHPVTTPFLSGGGEHAILPVSAAPWGSATILAISWMYIAMMGTEGLTKATQIAILNANYMAKRLEKHYKVLFRGKTGLCAHEFIIDVRPFEKTASIKVDDVAKRLQDYGFHGPTMSWPVPGTLMIEPTESEPKAELDRLCDALIAIRAEIADIESGKLPHDDNPLKHAPHTMHVVTATEWKHPYSREQAAFPAPWVKENKFWPCVARVDNPYGDRNLVCTCPPMAAYS